MFRRKQYVPKLRLSYDSITSGALRYEGVELEGAEDGVLAALEKMMDPHHRPLPVLAPGQAPPPAEEEEEEDFE